MGLIESIKAAAIRVTDSLNRINDPFDDFTRPALQKEQKKLWELESEFYADLMENFWGCSNQVILHRRPLPAGSPLDMGDQAIWHGVYTATLALRYHMQCQADGTEDPLGHLVDAVKGLQLHQNFHGEDKPRLIRGVSDDLRDFQDDASNDSASGHLLGIYFGWKFGPASMRPLFEKLADGLGSELLDHKNCLVGPTVAPTTYGALEQGWKTDPLRITLALAIYAVAGTITGRQEFFDAYAKLFVKYEAIVRYPKVKLWWLENQNDTHRAAIHLAILADLTTGDQRQCYVRGLERIRRMVAKLGNVWVNALCAFGGYGWAPDNRDHALKVLSEFTLKDKQFNDGRDNYEILKRTPAPWDGYKSILWNGTWMANQPLPRWMARSQDFFWQRNLRSLDPGSAGAQPDSRLNGGDFLAAYWLSRLTGTISAQD